MHTSRWLAALAVISLAGCAAPAYRTAPARATRSAQLPAKRAMLLTGVSCVARTCTAVGWYYTSAAGPRRTLAERWAGARWPVRLPFAPR
jgi:hypothetical protein